MTEAGLGSMHKGSFGHVACKHICATTLLASTSAREVSELLRLHADPTSLGGKVIPPVLWCSVVA
eukprot:9001926-Alexandrium_andersonii.AAC.1